MMEKLDVKRYRRSLLLRWLLMWVVMIGSMGCFIYQLVMLFVDEEASYSLLGMIGYMLLMVMQSNVVFLPKGVSALKCMKDDALLQRAWNEEHDERRMMICVKAGVPLIPIVGLILYAAGIVLFFVHKGISLGILIASIVFLTVSNIQYIRWNAKLLEEETSNEP